MCTHPLVWTIIIVATYHLWKETEGLAGAFIEKDIRTSPKLCLWQKQYSVVSSSPSSPSTSSSPSASASKSSSCCCTRALRESRDRVWVAVDWCTSAGAGLGNLIEVFVVNLRSKVSERINNRSRQESEKVKLREK